MKVIKAVKKPIVVEAIQLTKDNIWEVVTFLEGKPPTIDTYQEMGMWEDYERSVQVSGLKLMTLESDGQTQVADISDYIIKGVRGEFYPCKEDIFKDTYEIVEGA